MSLFTIQVSDEEQYGPVALETLKIWIREGSVKENSSIYDHTHLKWVRAGEIPQLMELFHPPAPSAPLTEPAPAAKEAVPKTVRVPSKTQAARLSGHSTSRSHGTSSKPKTLRTGRTESASGEARKSLEKGKDSTVLGRLTRILIRPFSKKTGEASKSKSQRIK